MLSQCPHCQKELKFNDGQKQKIQAALDGLKKGILKLGCPFCKQTIHLCADGSVADNVDAADKVEQDEDSSGRIKPPAYPDISWMANEICDEQEAVEDVPKALILMPGGDGRDTVGRVFTELGYQTSFPESAGDAVEQMRFVNFAAVVYHAADTDLTESQFHNFMSQMPMSRRRAIYYVMIGSKLRTLYNLEALGYSANLVVNEAEIRYFDTILKKGMQDYDELFGPYIAALGGD
jgi:hypothetical protein